jgi:FMN phosphatase YigB (HAD superfamily)
MRYIIFDIDSTINDRQDNRHLNMHRIREQYRNQLIEMVNMQVNLEDTNYETDRRIIKSLQEKYKLKINYNEYYEVKKFELKDNKKLHCIICLENYKYNDLIALMKCDHTYHYNCIKKWLNHNPNCPICRKDVIEEVILNIN